jgi:hypothetical protein
MQINADFEDRKEIEIITTNETKPIYFKEQECLIGISGFLKKRQLYTFNFE